MEILIGTPKATGWYWANFSLDPVFWSGADGYWEMKGNPRYPRPEDKYIWIGYRPDFHKEAI